MTVWDELLKTAVLGTQRGTLPTISADSELTSLLAQLQDDDPETALLNMAGVIALHARAGWLPPLPHLNPPPKGEEAVPSPFGGGLGWGKTCGLPIEQHLRAVLIGGHAVAMPEYLTAFHAAGYELPPSLLPNYLEKGANLVSIRPFILPILGERGKRLAALNPQWLYAILSELTLQEIIRQWKQENAAKRHKLLQQLRQTNPDKARQLLQIRWHHEPDSLRPRLVQLLIQHVSMADEPFLEKALDDRHFLVRQKAAEALTYLPDSRFSQRMNSYADQILSWTPQKITQISVNLPEEVSDAMSRDGILRRLSRNKAGLQRRQLTHLLASVTLSHWTKSWSVSAATDVSIDDILNAVQTTNWSRTLGSGFIIAAHRQQNSVWANAILGRGVGDLNARLVSVLTAADYRDIVANLTEQFTIYPPLTKGTPLRLLLFRWDHGWDTEMGLYWLTMIARHIKNESDQSKTDATFASIGKRFAQKCAVELQETAVSLLSSNQLIPYWRKIAQDMIKTLAFRDEMLRELQGARRRVMKDFKSFEG